MAWSPWLHLVWLITMGGRRLARWALDWSSKAILMLSIEINCHSRSNYKANSDIISSGQMQTKSIQVYYFGVGSQNREDIVMNACNLRIPDFYQETLLSPLCVRKSGKLWWGESLYDFCKHRFSFNVVCMQQELLQTILFFFFPLHKMDTPWACSDPGFLSKIDTIIIRS